MKLSLLLLTLIFEKKYFEIDYLLLGNDHAIECVASTTLVLPLLLLAKQPVLC